MELIRLFGSLIKSIAQAIAQILPFTSKFGIIRFICEQGTIFGISWIDKLLFFLANIISIAIVFVICSKVSMNAKAKAGLSILVYLAILSLFADKIFWFIVIGLLGLTIISFLAFFIINTFIKRKYD